jgi:hypothetical protein
MSAALQTTEPVQVTIRPARASEHKFVVGSWSRNVVQWDRQRAGPKPHEALGIDRAIDLGRRIDAIMIDAALLVRAHHRLVDEILAQPDVQVVVACLPDVPDHPVAWACWQGDTMHFVYTAPIARRCTIGRQLVLHSRCSVASHSTPDGLTLMRWLRRGTK